MNRRTFVRSMCYGGLAAITLPSITFAQVRQQGRLVFVLLRGGFDGLAAVVPYGDPAYRSLRGSFAFAESELLPLDDTFGLAPGLAPLRAFWENGEFAAVHAMAIPHRNTQPLRRVSHSRNGARPPPRLVGWMVEPPAASDVRRAIGDCRCGRDAALAERVV